MNKNHHEIIISGAGMIGLTFALLMAEKKIKVCIVDKNDKGLLFAQQDNRTTAISQGSHRIYRKLGIWSNVNTISGPFALNAPTLPITEAKLKNMREALRQNRKNSKGLEYTPSIAFNVNGKVH